jgi:hypothetical protein
MSCENVQELISLFLDGKLAAEARENVLAHSSVCRHCGGHLEQLQTQRALLRKMAQAPVPDKVVAQLRVLASHERERQLVRASVRTRAERLGAKINLVFDNLMRPVALPLTGGLLYTILLFGLLMPTLSFSHQTGGSEFFTIPNGRIVDNPYDSVADHDADHPRIEPISSKRSDFINVVELTIDETGRVVDWNVVRGELTPDMKSVILFSSFEPATNMGIATSGKILVVQSTPSATVRG